MPTGTGGVLALTAVSDASGNATFNLTAVTFGGPPVVALAVQTAVTDVIEARVTALSATSCTVNVRRSAGVVILGLTVLQQPTALVGATVHLMACDAI